MRPQKSYVTIEPGIAPLLAAINRTVRISSSEGHWYRAMRPYVSFKTLIQIGPEFSRLREPDRLTAATALPLASQIPSHYKTKPQYIVDKII